MDLEPTQEEIETWLTSTLRHACRVEFFLHQFTLGHSDPQRPHDLVGTGNKFSWPIIQGLALQYRNDPDLNQAYVEPAVRYHRKYQYHHQRWNNCHPSATPEEMMLGAIDTICSHLEDRKYQGGAKTLEEIQQLVRNKPRHEVKDKWLVEMIPRMMKVKTPEFGIIQLHEIPNIRLPQETYITIVERVEETLDMLTEKGIEL